MRPKCKNVKRKPTPPGSAHRDTLIKERKPPRTTTPQLPPREEHSSPATVSVVVSVSGEDSNISRKRCPGRLSVKGSQGDQGYNHTSHNKRHRQTYLFFRWGLSSLRGLGIGKNQLFCDMEGSATQDSLGWLPCEFYVGFELSSQFNTLAAKCLSNVRARFIPTRQSSLFPLQYSFRRLVALPVHMQCTL